MAKLERRDYFPSIIFQGQIEGCAHLNAHILSSIYALRDTELAGARGGARSGNWRSTKKLNKVPDIDLLKAQITAELEKVSAELQYSREHILKITSMWAHIIAPGSGNRAECRPGSLWTGRYCLQVPKGTGSVKFLDPRTFNVMGPPRYEKNNKPMFGQTKVEFKPRNGSFVLSPSWLYSEIEPNISEEGSPVGDFVSIAFDIKQKKITSS